MDATPTSTSSPAVPTPIPPPPVVAAWSRSAQLTTAFLFGVVVTLLAVHAWGLLRWGTRPAELSRQGGLTYRIDLNQAPRAELLQIPGVGESRAERIERYRREYGGFRAVDDLTGVHGIGPATLERMRDWVAVSGADAGEEAELSAPAAKPPSDPARKKAATDSGNKTESKKAAGLTEPIDINRATLTELQRLPGVGPKIAQRIVDERQKKPFQSVDDLRRVSGIGAKTLERLRPYITVQSDLVRAGKGK